LQAGREYIRDLNRTDAIYSRMGLVQSNLSVATIRPIVRPDTITPLPSLSIDTCKFTDGSVGFLVTTVDLAKNMVSYMIQLKDVYSPAQNTLVYLGKDESTLTFTKDILTSRVFCSLCNFSKGSTVVRQLVSTYDPLDNQDIDRIGTLFSGAKQT
jgi:hypothetical protein